MSYIFLIYRVLLDLLVSLVPLERMVLVVFVVILDPLDLRERPAILDLLAQLVTRDPPERLVLRYFT